MLNARNYYDFYAITIKQILAKLCDFVQKIGLVGIFYKFAVINIAKNTALCKIRCNNIGNRHQFFHFTGKSVCKKAVGSAAVTHNRVHKYKRVLCFKAVYEIKNFINLFFT